jgi:hypothetical protein
VDWSLHEVCQHLVVLAGREMLLGPNQGRQLVKEDRAVVDRLGAAEGSLGDVDPAQRVPATVKRAFIVLLVQTLVPLHSKAHRLYLLVGRVAVPNLAHHLRCPGLNFGLSSPANQRLVRVVHALEAKVGYMLEGHLAVPPRLLTKMAFFPGEASGWGGSVKLGLREGLAKWVPRWSSANLAIFLTGEDISEARLCVCCRG